MELMKGHDLCAASTYFQPKGSFGRRAKGKKGWGLGIFFFPAPPHESWDDLMRMAGCENRDGGHGVANHKEWNEMIRKFEREYIELI